MGVRGQCLIRKSSRNFADLRSCFAGDGGVSLGDSDTEDSGCGSLAAPEISF